LTALVQGKKKAKTNGREAAGTLPTTSLPQELSESMISPFGPLFYLYSLGRHPLQALIDDLFLSSHGHEKPTFLARHISLQDIDHHIELFDKLMKNRLINQMGGIS
jgi:hypothetical protein